MATIVQTPAGSWKAVIRKARLGIRIKVKTFTRKVDAEAWARKTESEIERGVWRDVGGADRVTLGEALDRYLVEVAPKHKGEAMERSYIAGIRIEPLARIALDRITRGNIQALRDKWQSDGYAIATINRRLTILHVVFDTARLAWDMQALSNPVDRMKLAGAEQRERRVSAQEIQALLAASRSHALSDAIKLAVETAMRRGELTALTWAMLDLQKGVAHLPASITKSARARDVPLSPAALEVLQRRRPSKPAPTARVLGLKDSHSITTALSRTARRARSTYEAACVDAHQTPSPHFLLDLHFHDLRHEATSRLAELFSLHELMKIVGHASSAMLARYYHPTAEDFAARLRSAAPRAQ